MKIVVLDPDIYQRVIANNGYCPCAIEKTKDTMCICKEFKEAEVGTVCNCGLYRKEA